MRYVALIAILLPELALSQTAQTNCYQTAPTAPPASRSITCNTYISPGFHPPQAQWQDQLPRSNPNAFAEGWERSQAMIDRQRQMQQQAELAAAQRRNIELQNEVLRRQLAQQPNDQMLGSDTAIMKSAYLDVLSDLPTRPLTSELGIGAAAVARAREILGRDPHPQARINAAAEMHSLVQKALEKNDQ